MEKVSQPVWVSISDYITRERFFLRTPCRMFMKQFPTIKIVEAKLDLLNVEFQVQIWLLRWQDIIFSELGQHFRSETKCFEWMLPILGFRVMAARLVLTFTFTF